MPIKQAIFVKLLKFIPAPPTHKASKDMSPCCVRHSLWRRRKFFYPIVPSVFASKTYRGNKKVSKGIFIFFLLTPTFILPFQYDKAAYAAQKGEWQQAQEQLNALLVDNHDRADMLYDTGIAAANLGQHEQALAYFSQAAQYSSDTHLKKQALFNAGNAAVATKRLPEALEKFEAVLALDSNDEYARHNRDKVREMLQKQQEQQQQNQQDKQNQEQQNQDQQDKEQQNQDQQNQENSSDQQQKDQQDNNNQDNKSDQKKDGKSGANEHDGQDADQNQQNSKEQSNDKKSGDSADNSNSSDRKDERNKQEQRAQPEQNDQRNGDQQSENKTNNKQDERDGQQHENHNKTPQKDPNQDTTVPSNDDKEQAQGDNVGNAAHQGQEEMEQAFASKMNNPLLARILEQQEAKDKAMNKQLMEAKMRQNGGGNDAYNNW